MIAIDDAELCPLIELDQVQVGAAQLIGLGMDVQREDLQFSIGSRLQPRFHVRDLQGVAHGIDVIGQAVAPWTENGGYSEAGLVAH